MLAFLSLVPEQHSRTTVPTAFTRKQRRAAETSESRQGDLCGCRANATQSCKGWPSLGSVILGDRAAVGTTVLWGQPPANEEHSYIWAIPLEYAPLVHRFVYHGG